MPANESRAYKRYCVKIAGMARSYSFFGLSPLPRHIRKC